MSQSDRDKWDKRYQDGAYSARKHPSALLVAWLPRLRVEGKQGRAIDVACGQGRNAIYLAQHGWDVVAVDVSEVALEGLRETATSEKLAITCIQRDLEQSSHIFDGPSLQGPFDLAVMVRYTNLPLISELKNALRPGGYLLIEEHLTTDADVVGPRDPRFRVPPGALRRAAAGLEIIHYREGEVEDPDRRPAALAQLVARKR